MRILNWVLATSLLGLSTTWAQDQPFGPVLDYGVGVRMEYHDNITQDPEDEIDDYLLAPFAEFGLSRDGSSLDLNFNGYVEYASYGDDTFSSELRGTLAADVLWRISEERFHWVLEENLARSPIDILELNLPNNLQHVNTFATGPDLILRMSASDRLIFGARYNNFYADERDDDFDGFGLSATWSRQAAANRGYAFRLDSSKLEFDNPSALNADYDRHQGYFQLTDERSVSGATNIFTLDLGYTKLQYDNPLRDDFDGPLFHLGWERQSANGSQLEVSLSSEVGDIAADVGAIVQATRPSLALQTASTGDPFEREMISVNWGRTWQRLSLDLGVSFDTQDYDTSNLDQDNFTGSFGLAWQLRPLVSFQANLDYTDQTFDNVNQDDQFLAFSMGITYQRTRHIYLELLAVHVDLDSTDPLQISNDTGLIAQFTYRR